MYTGLKPRFLDICMAIIKLTNKNSYQLLLSTNIQQERTNKKKLNKFYDLCLIKHVNVLCVFFSLVSNEFEMFLCFIRSLNDILCTEILYFAFFWCCTKHKPN